MEKNPGFWGAKKGPNFFKNTNTAVPIPNLPNLAGRLRGKGRTYTYPEMVYTKNISPTQWDNPIKRIILKWNGKKNNRIRI